MKTYKHIWVSAPGWDMMKYIPIKEFEALKEDFRQEAVRFQKDGDYDVVCYCHKSRSFNDEQTAFLYILPFSSDEYYERTKGLPTEDAVYSVYKRS
ncbi:MAG: hypothetical protein LBJ12_03500 [Oscillospiraceae bacterium]|jgi:hypothetical protein|nr:hypothetical protein [Oscillospiraceae bacterium]